MCIRNSYVQTKPPLDKFVKVTRKINFINKKGQTGQRLFQNGMILTIRANLELQKIIKEEYNVPFLKCQMTNQCWVESTFGIFRMMGNHMSTMDPCQLNIQVEHFVT